MRNTFLLCFFFFLGVQTRVALTSPMAVKSARSSQMSRYSPSCERVPDALHTAVVVLLWAVAVFGSFSQSRRARKAGPAVVAAVGGYPVPSLPLSRRREQEPTSQARSVCLFVPLFYLGMPLMLPEKARTNPKRKKQNNKKRT